MSLRHRAQRRPRRGAARMDVLTCLSDRRCIANRSRSETMPTTRPAVASPAHGGCRGATSAAPRRARCRPLSSVCTGALITSPIGVASGSCGSVTRPRMSCRVRMPSGAPAVVGHQHRADAPLVHRCQRLRQRRLAAHTPPARRAAACASGVSSDCSASACDAYAACSAWRDSSRKLQHAPVQEVGERRAVARPAPAPRPAAAAGRRCPRCACVGGGDGARGHHRTDRKQVAGVVLEAALATSAMPRRPVTLPCGSSRDAAPDRLAVTARFRRARSRPAVAAAMKRSTCAALICANGAGASARRAGWPAGSARAWWTKAASAGSGEGAAAS